MLTFAKHQGLFRRFFKASGRGFKFLIVIKFKVLFALEFLHTKALHKIITKDI